MLLSLLLFLPPAGNLLWDLHRFRTGRERLAAASLTAADPSPAAEVASLRQLLWEKERELSLFRGWSQAYPRYAPVKAEPLPLSDPSPRRSSLWVWAESFQGVNTRTPVAYRGALVGRVERVWTDQGLARVQTIRDSYFRVRFRYREATGFLWGTGKVDDLGRPLLEIRHLNVEVGFREGEPVITEGEDGFYPRGLPIGVLVRSEPSRAEVEGGVKAAGTDAGQFLVRGEFPLAQVPEVVLLVDRAALDAKAIIGKEQAE